MNSLTRFGKESLPQFQIEELKEAVAGASGLGLKTMAHANGRLPVRIALLAGCSSIEHGFFMGEENLALMAETGIFWVPTAFAMEACGTCAGELGGERLVAMKNLEHQLEQMDLARRLGVSLAVGTDAGSIGVHHGSAVINELKLFLEAGFSIEEAIKCASLNGANLLGLKRKGCIQKGWRADFVVVKGPPSSLPESLRNIIKIHAGVNGFYETTIAQFGFGGVCFGNGTFVPGLYGFKFPQRNGHRSGEQRRPHIRQEF